MEEIATQFVREIKKIQPAGPYRIIGGSFGGVVAFEMAHHLQKAGDKINLLAMIDTLPPGPRQKAKITSRLRLHWQRLRSIPISQYPSYLLNWWKIFLVGLARRKFFRKFFTFKSLDSVIQGTEIIRAGRTAYALYDPLPYPGNMVLFKAKEKPWYVDWEPLGLWKNYIQGDIIEVKVDGTHGLVYKPPYVEGLARAIRNHL